MMTFITKFIRTILVSVLSVAFLWTPITGNKEETISHARENCNASFAVVADVHIKNGSFRQTLLELGLYDMEKAEDKLDAVVFDGDTTDQGNEKMWKRFSDALSKYDCATNKIIVMGNHDSRGPVKGDLEKTKQKFIELNKNLSNREISEVYYSTTINGYPAIVLGSEGNSTWADISQNQIDWFAQEMKKASLTGKPIFVFCHQSFNGTHGLPYTWDMKESDNPALGGMGDASDDILNIIKQYNNVFYISGHIHTGFTKEDNKYIQSVERHGNYTLINLPSYGYADAKRGNHLPIGTGYVVEVYDDQVLLRARNFSTGTWCTKFDVAIDIEQ